MTTVAEKLMAIGKVLIAAPENIQVTGKLVVADLPEDGEEDYLNTFNKKYVSGYCVLGYLGCQKNMFDGLTYEEIEELEYKEILKAWGFTDEELEKAYARPDADFKDRLQSMLPSLNDDDVPFKQIGTHLISLAEAEAQ